MATIAYETGYMSVAEYNRRRYQILDEYWKGLITYIEYIERRTLLDCEYFLNVS